MMSYQRILVIVAILCAPVSTLCSKLYGSEATFLWNNAVLSGAQAGIQSDSSSDERTLYLPGDFPWSAEARQKRTFSGDEYFTQVLRNKMYQNMSAKNDRQSKFTLSLDVHTNLMNILFSIAKSKTLHAKAENNARLMAQIGKRK